MEQGRKNAPSQEVDTGLFNKALRVLAIPLAAISGFWVASRKIYVNTYDNAKAHGLFKDILDKEHAQGMQAIGAEAISAVKAGRDFNIVEKTLPFHTDYKKLVKERMEDVGLGNTFKRWKFLRADQKQTAIIEFMTVAGIAVGALLTVANSKTVANIFKSHGTEQNQIGT